jgi:DNA repair protein RadC
MLPLLKGLDHEECWVLYLNRSNHVTGRERLTSGTADATLIDPKLVLRGAIGRQAKAVILVHNHPSGSPMPGEADIWETQRLRQALKALDVKLFDHVILSDCAWYSFQDERCRPADRL